MTDQDNYYIEPLPPSFEMSNIKERQPLPPVPTVSSKVGSPSNAVEHTQSGATISNIHWCRLFLIILASFIIGGFVEGAISYLLVSQSGEGPEITLPPTTSQGETEWQLVFKAVAGVGDQHQIDPYKVWETDAPYNEDVPEAKQLDTSFMGHYQSSFVINWQRRNIREVKVGLFDASGNELIDLIFDGEGSNRTNWFAKDRLLSSPWTDLFTEPQNYFSIVGDTGYSLRRWFINRNYGGCGKDAGWLVVGSSDYCDWHEFSSEPVFLYSKEKTYTNWNTEQNVGKASIFAIFVKTKLE